MRINFHSAFHPQDTLEYETIHFCSHRIQTEFRRQLCQSALSICSICLFETIQLNLKKCFLSNKRRKCSLSYMDWPIFLGFPFILNFLWTGYKIKKHFSRIFLSCEPCRPSSEALYYLEILFVSIKFLSK